MYAVFENEVIIELTSCADKALQCMNTNIATRSMVNCANLCDLARQFDLHRGGTFKAQATEKTPEEQAEELVDGLSDAATKVFDKLDEMGVNIESAEEVARTVREKGEKLYGGVRSLGIKGMKTVGQGFVALGDLLQKADEAKCNEESCCQNKTDKEFLDELNEQMKDH